MFSVATAPSGGLADALVAPFPNPTTRSARVEFTLSQPSDITLDVFDVTGRRVASLAGGAYAAGTHGLDWDASRVSAGLYVLRLRVGGQGFSRRITVVR